MAYPFPPLPSPSGMQTSWAAHCATPPSKTTWKTSSKLFLQACACES